MPALPRESFARRLAALPPRALRDLAADVWAARGFDTRIEGDIVVAERGGDRVVLFPSAKRRLRGPARPSTDAGVDVVVDGSGEAESLAADLGAGRVAPDELYNVLLYGIDRDRAVELLGAHLDAPIRVDAETAAAAERDGTTDGAGVSVGAHPDARAFRGRARRALDRLRSTDGGAATLVVLGLVVFAAVGLGFGPGAFPRPADLGGSAGVDGTAAAGGTGGAGNGGDGDDRDGDDASRSNVTAGTGGAERVGAVGARPNHPPGVDPRQGALDTGELVGAHVAALDGRSYRWTARFDRSGHVDGRGEWSRIRRLEVVGGDGRRLTNVSGVRVDRDGNAVRASYASYDGGQFRYRRTDGENEPVSYQRTAAAREDRLRPQGTWAIQRYLGGGGDASVSRLDVDGEALYRVTVREAPPGEGAFRNVSDYRATAYVTDDGLVARLEVEYAVAGAEGGSETAESGGGEARSVVRYEFDYDEIGNATVDEPAWLSEARERTEGGVGDGAEEGRNGSGEARQVGTAAALAAAPP